jgi:hypothetical protein
VRSDSESMRVNETKNSQLPAVEIRIIVRWLGDL